MRTLLWSVLGPSIRYGMSVNLASDGHIRLSADGQGHLSLLKRKNVFGEE